MDEAEKRLYQRFAEKQNLVSKEPVLSAAFTAPAEKLEEGKLRVRAILAEGPKVSLSDVQQTDLATARFPELQGVLALFADGLERQPAISSEIETQPALLRRLSGLDRALGRQVFAGQLLTSGGENGELLTSAAAEGLCQGALQRAAAARGDDRLTAAQKSTIATLFTEPMRLDKERRAREAQPTDSATTAYEAQISAAEKSAAMARVIETFLDSTRRGS